MAANRVFYDADSLIVLAVHPADQPVDARAYAAQANVASLIADAEDIPGPVEAVREPVLDEKGDPVTGPDGKPLEGRTIHYQPRRLTQDWIDNHVAPVPETIDGTKGKLALLDADKLDAFTTAIDGISDAKDKIAAKLKFDASTWSRSDPVWNKLGKSAKVAAKAIDDIWRAAAA